MTGQGWRLPSIILAGVLGTTAAWGAAAQEIVIRPGPVERSEHFGCRIPIDVDYQGDGTLDKLAVSVVAFDADGLRLSSAGFRLKERPLIEGDLLPVQLSLPGNVCGEIQVIRFTYAACTINGRDTEQCIGRIRVEPRASDGPAYVVEAEAGAR